MVLAAATIVAAFASVRGGLDYLTSAPPGAHRAAWTETKESRIARALAGFYPAYASIRAHVPDGAVLYGWVPQEVEGLPLLFDLLRVSVAPRVCVPLSVPGQLADRVSASVLNSNAVFAIELHPTFANMAASGEAPPELVGAPGAWVKVAETPDFVLYEYRRRGGPR